MTGELGDIMPIDYAFFTDPPLAFIRYHGHIVVDELINAANKFALEEENVPGLPHFFDFSRVTSYKLDYTKFLGFMARLSEIYPPDAEEQMFVFYAPSGKPTEMAELARRPWEGSGTILIRVAQCQQQAFDILGGDRPDVRKYMEALA